MRSGWPRDAQFRALNIEHQIESNVAILEVFSRERFPEVWASAQYNLGLAHQQRIRGDRADNLEKAIAAHEASLTVRTRETLPIDWAATQHDLAIAYRGRIHGDRADNLEKAIAAHEAALTVRTRQAMAVEWAATQNNLALAYADRIRVRPRRQPGKGHRRLRGGACCAHARRPAGRMGADAEQSRHRLSGSYPRRPRR